MTPCGKPQPKKIHHGGAETRRTPRLGWIAGLCGTGTGHSLIFSPRPSYACPRKARVRLLLTPARAKAARSGDPGPAGSLKMSEEVSSACGLREFPRKPDTQTSEAEHFQYPVGRRRPACERQCCGKSSNIHLEPARCLHLLSS